LTLFSPKGACRRHEHMFDSPAPQLPALRVSRRFVRRSLTIFFLLFKEPVRPKPYLNRCLQRLTAEADGRSTGRLPQNQAERCPVCTFLCVHLSMRLQALLSRSLELTRVKRLGSHRLAAG
jgi:hypothetical protein